MLRIPVALVLAAAPVLAWAQDSDHDGARDAVDAFPCDPSASALSFAPSESAHGMLIAEDQWPHRGDLDFNDVVLSYNVEHRLDSVGRVTALRATFNPLALGGRFDNGLGLHLPIPRAAVSRVTRTIEGGVTEELSLSAGDDEATLTVLPNLRTLFGGLAGQINSVNGATLDGDAIEIVVELATPVSMPLSAAPYDLYVFRSDRPAHEIHRPEHAGTAAMDGALFGTADDGSSGGRSFVDDDGLPFLIFVPELAPYPAEAVEIARVFPSITTFAASGGTQARDFYLQSPVLSRAYSGTPITPRFVTTQGPADVSCVPTVPSTGLSMWLRADDLGASTGAPVASWSDASGAGVNATQSAAARQPIVVRNALNGHAVVRFDGADDRLDLGVHLFPRAADPLTVFVVLRTNDTSAHVVGTGSSDPGFLTTYGQGLSLSTGRPLLKSSYNSAGVTALGGAPINDDQARVLSAIISPGSSVLRVDGLRAAERVVAPNAYPYVRSTIGASDGMALGNARDPLAGDIAEIIVFRRALSAAERSEVEQYLGGKYGVTIGQEPGCDGVPGSFAEIDACGICGGNGSLCSSVPQNGLAVWLRAHDGAGLGDGGAVHEWPSARGSAAAGPSQQTLSRTPRYRANVANGYGAIEFDGGDRLDFPTNVAATYPRTMFMVLTTTQLSAHLFGTGSSSPDFLLTYGSGLVMVGGRPVIKANSNGSGLFLQGSIAINDGAPRVFSAIGLSGSSSMVVRGLAAGTSATAPNPYTPYSRATLGASDGSATDAARDGFMGRMIEVLVYDRALSATERSAVQSYLDAKYGTN